MRRTERSPEMFRIILRGLVMSLAVFGGVLVVVGSPLERAAADLPFLGSIQLDGFDRHRNGWETLTFGALFLGVSVLPIPVDRRLRWGAAAALAAVALSIALIDAVELWSRKPLVDGLGLGLVDVSVGIGVLFVLVGSSIALVAAVVLFGAAQWGRSADSAAPTSLRGSMVHDDV